MENRYRARRRFEGVQDDFPTEVGDISWVDSSNSEAFNFSACVLETGEDAYIAQADVDYQTVSGFTTRQVSDAYIPYGCIERVVQNYKVLTVKDPLRFQWLKHRNGSVPKTAVVGGIDGRTLQYIGRTCTPLSNGRTYLGAMLTLSRFTRAEGCRPGKVFPPHRCLYVPYNGGEYIFDTYEVLCYKPTPGKLKAICKWKILTTLKKNNQSKKAVIDLPLPHMIKNYLMQ